MNIQQIRAKYPQYKDLSDKQLADALHAKFYSDLPIQDYYSRIGLAPPETTIGGQAKELVKGLIPGAVGLVEQAAIGASALLPEDYEKPTRETIAKVAGAVKAPFAAAPGYEESVGRKLSEAVGSTIPFVLAGPLGWAGRAAALGLGVGAGAGEARTRAEKEGATAEQRATATALGIIPGAAEVFAPFRILSRIPDAATAQGVQLVKRALLAGGEEAAQEAASGFAQNLIAKGVYKPEQELIEGLGEQAAYGGATGAIVQGLMDLALGRRARGATAPPTGEAPIDKAVREAQPPAPPTAPAAPAGIPPLPDTYAELVLYGEQVKQLPKSKERDEALKAAREKREAIIAEEVKQNRLSAEKAKEFLTAEEAAAAEIQRRDELETEAPAEPTPAAVPEPTVVKKGEPPPTGLQSTDIEALGISKKQPIYKRLLGKDMDDPAQRDAALADIENYLVKGYGSEESRANLTAFKERFAPVAEPTPTEVPSDTAVVEPAGGAGAPVVGEPGAGAAPAGAGVPEPSGMVPAVADVGEPVAGEGQQPPAVAPTPAAEETPISAPPPAVEATTPAPTETTKVPEYTEKDIEEALAANLITPEQAERAREELQAEEVPSTAMGAAFQKQIDSIKAQMNALRLKNGRLPAKKSPARAKFDALQEQLDALQPAEKGKLTTRLEKMGASGVVGSIGTRPTIDIDAIRENLTKARAAPKMYEAMLNYIGVDKEGNYLPTTYSSDEAAELAGLKRSSGANVRRAAEAMGVTADVISRFHAGQTDKVGIAKNVSESGTGLTDVQPKRGLLYEPPTKKKPAKAVGFLRPALTEDGKLDFSTLTNRQVAEMYARASNFDPKRENNIEVINQLNGEIDARTNKDKKAMQQALDSAYRVVRIEEEEAAADETEIDDLPEETEAEDTTRRLSDETDFQQVNTGSVDLQNSREMDDALRGKPFSEAVDYAIKNARDDIDRQILVKAKRRVDELTSKGVQFSFELTGQGRILSSGALGLAKTTSAGLGEATTVDVILNGFTGNPDNTLAQETLAHEIVHAVTVAQITYAPQGTAAIKLRALQQELVKIYNQRFKAGTLTATEKGVVSYALQNDKELLAYGLTNREVQNWLASTPSPSGGTFLSRLFNVVSQVLGLKGKENSALAQLMSVSEEILDEPLGPYVAEANKRGLSFGKQANTTGIPSWVLKEAQGLKPVWNKGPIALYEGTSVVGKTIFVAAKQGVGRTQVDIQSYTGSGFTSAELAELRQVADSLRPQTDARITPQAEATAKELDAIGERKQDRFRDKVGRQLKGNVALRLREKLTDSLSPMEDFFVKAYGGAIRTAAGRLSPMVLLSRALDSGRVSKAAQIEGGLARKDGLIVAAELKDADGRPVSYSGVLNRIAETAKTQNKTYEEYRKTIDNILYGHREHGLRQKAREMEQQAQALEAAGKKDKAKALRDDIPTLLLNDAQIDRAEAAFQQDPFIKEVLADLDTIRFNMLDMLVETGRISAEQAQDYKDAVGYIPFERIGEYENAWTGATRGANRGVAALKKVRDFEGSERKSTSVIENFSGLMDWGTSEAMKNEAGRRALEDMELLGAAQRRENPPKADSPGGVVTVFEDGKPVKFYVPDPAHLATFSMADPQLSNIIKGLSLATRTLRAGVTSMPPFAIKQVFDDIVRAYAYTGVKNNGELVKNVLFNFPKNWFNEVFKRKTDSVRDLERLGIVGRVDFTQHTNLKDILRESGAQKGGLAYNILRVMEAGAKASDISVREAVYKQVMKETGDAAQAESAAREIINFSRRGSSKFMNQMISIIPFFNAYARGMDKLATAAAGGVVGQSTGTARSMFYTRMMYLTALGIAYAVMMQDDEEYEALPDHVRDTNWVLPYGKHLGFTPSIPIPAELAFFFKAIPERVLRYYKYQGTEEEQAAVQVLGELAKRGVDVFSSPNLMAQGIRPLVENMVNYSFFLGRPLESTAQLKLDPFARYGTGTSESMKALANAMESAATATGIEAFAISPIKLENAVRGIFGTAAGLALTMSDMLINPNRTDRPMHQQLASQLTGASALMKSPVGTRYMDVIYDLESKVERVNGTYNRLMKNDPEKVEDYIREHIGLFSIRGPLQGIMESIRTLNEAAQMIDRDTTLSPQERRQRIDELRAQQNEIARQVYMLRNLARNTQRGF